MSTSITTRAAVPEDVHLIALLIKELAIYQKQEDSCVSSSKAIHDALFTANPSAEVIIGELNGEAVGFALFFHNYSTFLGKKGLNLEDLFVLPSARGNGIGKLLLQSLAKIADERGCARMEWLVLDWNAPSIAFYRSLGAHPMEGWSTFRMGSEAIVALAGTN